MSNKFKGIDIKNRTCYFFNDIIKIKNFDPNKINTKIMKIHAKIFLFTTLDM